MIDFVIKMTNGTPDGHPMLASNFKQVHNIRTKALSKADVQAKGFAPFIPQDKPSEDLRNKVEDKGLVVGEDGYVRPSFEMVAKTEDEMDSDLMAAEMRSERDRRLAAYDWMAAKQVMTGESISPEILAYCQALRDITSHANFPFLKEEDWPVKPE